MRRAVPESHRIGDSRRDRRVHRAGARTAPLARRQADTPRHHRRRRTIALRGHGARLPRRSVRAGGPRRHPDVAIARRRDAQLPAVRPAPRGGHHQCRLPRRWPLWRIQAVAARGHGRDALCVSDAAGRRSARRLAAQVPALCAVPRRSAHRRRLHAAVAAKTRISAP